MQMFAHSTHMDTDRHIHPHQHACMFTLTQSTGHKAFSLEFSLDWT